MAKITPKTARKPKRTSHASRQPTKPSPDTPTPPERRREDGVLMGFPLKRVWAVHARLSRSERTTAESLAKELNVSRRTIMRDLEAMADQLDMPIEWDNARKTYYYTRECVTLPILNIDVRDALTLALVARVCETLHGWSFGQRLDAIVKKIAPVLGDAVSLTVDGLDQVIAPPSSEALDEFEHFFPLFEAIQGRREVRMHYTKSESNESERRIVQPLVLARRRDHRWIVVVFDPMRGDLRDFVLIRIDDIEITDNKFEPLAGLDLTEHVRKSLGACPGDEEHEVRVALDSHAAFYAREQPWHHSQRLKDRPDGRVELTMRVNDLPGARNLVLRCGSHVEVLAPAERRNEVRASLEATLAQYAAP